MSSHPRTIVMLTDYEIRALQEAIASERARMRAQGEWDGGAAGERLLGDLAGKLDRATGTLLARRQRGA